MTPKLQGLVAATHTPFDAQGGLALAVVEKQAELLARTGAAAVFVGGTTGESHSLTMDERLTLAERWRDVLRGTPLRLVVHVGSNCLADARTLAAQAQKLKADAVSAVAPSYFKPKNLECLIACCADIAAAAPDLPFYHYDIPGLTGLRFSMPEFLDRAADRIPNLAGIKFSNPDLMAYQQCLQAGGGRFDLPWGIDEYLLAALALGGIGAVGSSYNFAAPIYRRLLAAFAQGNLAAARTEQLRSVRLIDLLGTFDYLPAAKATMGFLGVDVGPPRLPSQPLTAEQNSKLRERLQEMGFFGWLGS